MLSVGDGWIDMPSTFIRAFQSSMYLASAFLRASCAIFSARSHSVCVPRVISHRRPRLGPLWLMASTPVRCRESRRPHPTRSPRTCIGTYLPGRASRIPEKPLRRCSNSHGRDQPTNTSASVFRGKCCPGWLGHYAPETTASMLGGGPWICVGARVSCRQIAA